MGGSHMPRILDAATGKPVANLRGHRRKVLSVSWSPDGDRIATRSEDATARIWDASTGTSLFTLAGHDGDVDSLAWSPDGERLITGSTDTTVRVWNVTSGECVATLEGHERGVSFVSWSPDGRRIVSSASGTLAIWDSRLEDARPLWRGGDRRRRVRPLVDRLFEEHVALDQVRKALAASPTLSSGARVTALRMAEARGGLSAEELLLLAFSLVNPDRKDRTTDVVAGLRVARQAAALASVAPPPDPADGMPLKAMSHHILGWALFFNGHYDEAVAESKKLVELASGNDILDANENFARMQKMVAEARTAKKAPVKSPDKKHVPVPLP